MGGRFADSKGALIIWKVESLVEARKIAEADPLVIGDLLTFELREWPVAFDYTQNHPKVH